MFGRGEEEWERKGGGGVRERKEKQGDDRNIDSMSRSVSLSV